MWKCVPAIYLLLEGRDVNKSPAPVPAAQAMLSHDVSGQNFFEVSITVNIHI